MIELRWVSRELSNPADGTSQVMHVLQYRQWLIRLDAGGAITPTPLPVEWTPWHDVPTVSEE